MREQHRPDDDDAEEPQRTGPPSTAPGDVTGDAMADDDFDLLSLPGRRKPQSSSPVPRTSPPTEPPATQQELSVDDFRDAPPTTAGGGLPPSTQVDPVANERATVAPGETEVETREVDVEREMATLAGSFAASAAPAPPTDPDEAETIVDKGSERPVAPPQKGTNPAANPTKGSRLSGGTARDPAAGSAASRGTSAWSGPLRPTQLAAGQLLAERYELIERLGKGGMGEVWKAKHTLLQGMRAIKVIKASISSDPQFRERFLNEGQTMMRVKHPGVVEVTDLDETKTSRELFMVMEYLKGRTIYDAIRSKEKPLQDDVRDSARILREVAIGMQRIHDERIVHKDLKSDNVLLVRDEEGLEHPKVIDFGLAKRMGDADAHAPGAANAPVGQSDLHTTLSGTLAYMAPEQFRSEASSFQSDIYAFGVMAYEIFSKGEYPLPRGTLEQYLLMHRDGKVPETIAAKRPDLDPDLVRILDRCLAGKREERPESFRAVANDIQWWLDKPVRAARRKRIIISTTAAAALLGAAVWGVFFSGKNTATLSDPRLVVAGDEVEKRGGAWHLREASLRSVELAATLKGKVDRPALEIDGKARDVRPTERDGKLVAAVDLSDLADGEHDVSWRASHDASPVLAKIDVDRVAPKIRGTVVRGAVVTPQGIFSNAQSPEVVVDLDEAASRIASVIAYPADGTTPAEGQREAMSDRWLLKGTAPGDGHVKFDVVAKDLAGNEVRSTFEYVRDTQKPKVEIADFYRAYPMDRTGSAGVLGLHVRNSSGSQMRLKVDEQCVLSVVFGSSAPVTQAVERRGDVEIAIPNVPATGLATKLTARDVAGNETVMEFPLDIVLDVIRVTTASSSERLVVNGDAGFGEGGNWIVVLRFHPADDPVTLWYESVQSPDGSPTTDTSRHALPAELQRTADEGKTWLFVVSPKVLHDGVYRIGASAEGDPRVMTLLTTVDSTPPAVESVVVARPDGGEIREGQYALAQDVVVRAVVSDLSLTRIDLDGTAPQETVQPGRHTYTFHKTLEHEGATTWTFAVSDGAGHPIEKSITILGDWTAPTLALIEPSATTPADDITAVAFAGRCSEARYRLVVQGPDGLTRDANCLKEDFTQAFLLPQGDPLNLQVFAEDPAGHKSNVVPVALHVRHRATELPSQITWTQNGVTAQMEKVEPGDVVIGGRVLQVARSFLDRTEVTNRDYRRFLEATKGARGAWCHPDEPKDWDHTPTAATWKDPKWNADDLPVVNVSYWDAYAFAKWSGRRLPTEGEWVMAATRAISKTESEPRAWPPFAAGEWKDGVLATAETVKGTVSAMKSDDVCPIGCIHMGGNVSEWVTLPGGAGTRGGNWHFSKRAADVVHTPAKAWDRSFRADTIGFRCAKDPDEVQR